MKRILILLSFLLLVVSSFAKRSHDTVARTIFSDEITAHTSDEVVLLAGQIGESDPMLLQANIRELPFAEKVKLSKTLCSEIKKAQADGVKPNKTVCYILALFVPPVAVGLWTDWARPTFYNLLWTCLFGLPGVVHAFIVINR